MLNDADGFRRRIVLEQIDGTLPSAVLGIVVVRAACEEISTYGTPFDAVRRTIGDELSVKHRSRSKALAVGERIYFPCV